MVAYVRVCGIDPYASNHKAINDLSACDAK